MANITYTQVNEYMIPNLTLPPEETKIHLGKWGILHKYYLAKHNPVLFATLLTQDKLYQHCAEVENQARAMFDNLVKQMKNTEGLTEQLKEQKQWEWLQKMNNIQQQATEIVCKELIYV